MSTNELRVGLIGLGTVGSAFLEVLRSRTDAIRHRTGIGLNVVSIAVARPHIPRPLAGDVPVHGSGAAATLAAFLEDGVATAYLRLVALDDPGLRAWGARQVRASALRATSWSGRAAAFPGLPASTGATTPAPRPAAS